MALKTIGHQKKPESHRYDATDATMQRLKVQYAIQTRELFTCAEYAVRLGRH